MTSEIAALLLKAASHGVGIVFAVLVTMSVPCSVRAASEIKWTGAGNTSAWSDGGNWDGGTPPGQGDIAVIPGGKTAHGVRLQTPFRFHLAETALIPSPRAKPSATNSAPGTTGPEKSSTWHPFATPVASTAVEPSVPPPGKTLNLPMETLSRCQLADLSNMALARRFVAPESLHSLISRSVRIPGFLASISKRERPGIRSSHVCGLIFIHPCDRRSLHFTQL